MAIFQSYIIYCSILFIMYFSEIILAIGDGWCNERILVKKTRTIRRYGDWMYKDDCNRPAYGEPYSYEDTETYETSENVRKCCPQYQLRYGECKPVCDTPCPTNSYCNDTNVCKCNEGYAEVTENSKTIDCRPICSKGCPTHSSCTSPNQCTCDVGYEGTINCSSACQEICGPNSYCDESNHCACNEGYALNKTLVGECQPVCAQVCPTHSKCTAPNECTCDTGYEGHDCQPVCREGCAPNSFCAAPEQCNCNEGYKRDTTDAPSEEECQPVCSEGCSVNGYCSQPEVCSCHDGFEMNYATQSCQPVCSFDCPANSICGAPQLCHCDAGYVVSENGTQCEPICANGCPAPTDDLVDFTQCQSRCKCWYEFDRMGLTTRGSCRKLCVDDLDQHCLNLTQCRCNLEKLQLICNSTSDGEYSGEDKLIYSCVSRQALSIPKTQLVTTEPLRTKSEEDEENVANPNITMIFWILAGIVVGFFTLTLLYKMLIWCIATKLSHVRRRSCGFSTLITTVDLDL